MKVQIPLYGSSQNDNGFCRMLYVMENSGMHFSRRSRVHDFPLRMRFGAAIAIGRGRSWLRALRSRSENSLRLVFGRSPDDLWSAYNLMEP